MTYGERGARVDRLTSIIPPSLKPATAGPDRDGRRSV
jgi:hypothetical protein